MGPLKESWCPPSEVQCPQVIATVLGSVCLKNVSVFFACENGRCEERGDGNEVISNTEEAGLTVKPHASSTTSETLESGGSVGRESLQGASGDLAMATALLSSFILQDSLHFLLGDLGWI